MADERYPFGSARSLPAAETRAAEIDDRARLAADLVAGEVSDIRSPQGLAKHSQGIHKAINFITRDISRWLHSQGKALAQRRTHTDAMDVQKIRSRQIAQVLLLGKHAQRIRGRVRNVLKLHTQ